MKSLLAVAVFATILAGPALAQDSPNPYGYHPAPQPQVPSDPYGIIPPGTTRMPNSQPSTPSDPYGIIPPGTQRVPGSQPSTPSDPYGIIPPYAH